LQRRRDRGVSIVEWGAVLVLVAGIVTALLVSGLPGDVATYTKAAACEALGGTNCGLPEGGDGNGGDRPGGNPGNPNNPGPGEGGDQPTSDFDRAQREKDAADREADAAEDEFGDLKGELLDLVKSLIGLDDLEKCITEGDIAACLWTLASALPLGKALKFIKMIPKLAKFLLRIRKVMDRVNDARKRRRAADDALDRARQSCGLASFAAGSTVLMADGSRRPIEDVDIGDRVWASDPATGHSGGWPVTALITSGGRKHLVDVTVDPDGVLGGPTETITATDRHPFWLAGENRWVDAADLLVADGLRTPSGRSATVLEAREYTRTGRVYNLTVAGPHTYHVTAGVDLLVHNAAACPKKAKSYRSVNSGTFKTRDEAVAAAQRDVKNNTTAKYREECSKGCHVHVDIYNKKGEILETRHYTYHQK
jgi:hypothetical protein